MEKKFLEMAWVGPHVGGNGVSENHQGRAHSVR